MSSHLEILVVGFSRFSVLWLQSLLYPAPPSVLQVSFLEKKVTELENDSLTSGGLKSKLKQENMQLVHRSGARWPWEAQSGSPVSSFGLDSRPAR